MVEGFVFHLFDFVQSPRLRLYFFGASFLVDGGVLVHPPQ